MNKPTLRYMRWLAQRRWREARRRQNRRAGGTPRREPPTKTILAPANISFRDNHDETAQFLATVRREVDQSHLRRMRLVVDLAPALSIRTAGALCLVAELDRWQRQRGGAPLQPTTLSRWNPEVVRRLADMGFFDVLETDVPDHLRRGGPGASRFIRFMTNVMADPTHYAAFRREVGEPLAEPSDLSLGLYGSIGEAIGNAVEHAYPDGFSYPPRMGRRWWLTGSVDVERMRLTVAILDHGISIPGSLPKSRSRHEILALLARLFPGKDDDGKLIEAAMEYGKSRMNEPQRGKGLGDVLALAMEDPSNRLRVISRHGHYVYEAGRSRSWTQATPLNGTLIEWELALPRTPAPAAPLEN